MHNMYTGARACLRSVHKAEQSVRCQSNADYITLNQLGTRALAVDTAAHSAHTQCVRCGNMQNQCAWSMTHIYYTSAILTAARVHA
jgi:hypothetical protein